MKFRFTATFDTFLHLEVEADSLEAAQTIADESDGGDWKANHEYGDWHILHEDTKRFNATTQQWEYANSQ